MPALGSLRMLSTNDLREIDEVLISYMREGRVTPVYCQQRILADGERESISRGYIQERLARFVEHGHVENLQSTGLYELVADPLAEQAVLHFPDLELDHEGARVYLFVERAKSQEGMTFTATGEQMNRGNFFSEEDRDKVTAADKGVLSIVGRGEQYDVKFTVDRWIPNRGEWAAEGVSIEKLTGNAD